MIDQFTLKGKTILVTGAASGIGKQCALDFSISGANLILLDMNCKELDKVKRECEDNGVKCIAASCNLIDYDSIPSIIEESVNTLGSINGLLHAAGIEKTLPFNKFTHVDYEKIYAVNVVSAMNLISILSKKKNRGNNAKYVLIASITALVGRPGVNAYAASKGALVSAVKTLALELASKDITVNCISPGTILTPLMEKMLASLNEEQRNERISGFPLGIGKPSDVANVAHFLLSDAARWITGQNIIVDGGYTSK